MDEGGVEEALQIAREAVAMVERDSKRAEALGRQIASLCRIIEALNAENVRLRARLAELGEADETS